MKAIKQNCALRYLDLILVLFFAVFICVITTSKIIEDDVFIHLVTGKYIVENKTVPSADMFGYVTEGTMWIPYEWLWQAVTYLVWEIGDYELLSVLRTVIIVIFFLLYYFLLKKFKIPVPLFIVLGILMCFGMLGRLAIRPHILSYLFLSVLLSVLFYYKYFGFKKSNLLYLIPSLFLVWANVHMSVLLGLAVFSMFLFSETIIYLGRKNAFRKNKNIFSYDDLKSFYTLFIVSFAVIFINPHFADTYIYVHSLLTMPELEYINEWASPFDGRFISGYYVRAYFIFLILGITILFYSFKTKEVFPAVLYVVVGIFSMKSLRYTADFIIVTFIPLVISVNYFLKSFKLKTNYLNNYIIKAIACAALIFLTVNTYNNEVYRVLNVPFRETGFGINNNYFPVSLFDFMEKQKICEIGYRPFNSMRIGGYFIWNFEKGKNFVDNRCLSGSILNEYLDINFCRNDFEEKLRNYDVDFIIYCIPSFTARPVEIEMNLIAYLSKNESWKLVYWDDISFLFVRNENKFRDVISNYEYKYLTPLNCFFHKNVIVNAMKNDNLRLMNEINRKLSEDKNGEVINDLVKYLNLKSISSLR